MTTKIGRVFVSHASQDREIADELARGLKNAGLDVWLAADDVHTGENYAEEIFAALEGSDAVVVIISQNSVSSPHVRREMNLAIDRSKRLLPFALELTLVSGNELPPDWRYWLGIVQVEPFGRVADAVQLVIDRLRPSPMSFAAQNSPRRVGRAPSAADEVADVRAAVIQVASDQNTFGHVVTRCRHLRLARNDVIAHVRAFRDRGLVAFDEPLRDSTTIHLAT